MRRRHFIASVGSLALGATAPYARFAMAAPTASTLAERLARYAASLRYDDLDEQTIETAKSHFIDALGCGVAALRERPVAVARKVALANAGANAGSTVLGTSRRTSPDLAAFANGAAIRYYDLNDVYAGKEIGHPSDNIAACLAQAQAENATGRDLILAIVLAYEIDCRLMDAAAISSRGWDHPIYSLPASALAAGKLMRLSVEQLTQAVNLAINGHLALNQTRVQVISNWKGLADADAARNGVFSAALARENLTGPAPIFEGEAGFFKQVSGPFEIDVDRFGGEGRRFRINDCSVKFYPAQALTQTAIVAGIAVARQVGDLGRVKSVEIRTSHEGYFSAGTGAQKWAPETGETADHSLPYVTARAMFDGDISHASYSEHALHDPAIRAFMAKITVVEDPELTKAYPRLYATIVTATLDDGRTITQRVDDIPGFASHPAQRADFERKFNKNVLPGIGASNAQAALRMLWNLERQQGVRGLLDPFSAVGGDR